jgi:hypothetical protein
LERGNLWTNVVAFTFTSGVWFYILVKAVATKLNFISLLAGLLLMSQIFYLYSEVINAVYYIRGWVCLDPNLENRMDYYPKKKYWVQYYTASLLFLIGFDLTIWLYAAKYWVTGINLQQTFRGSPVSKRSQVCRSIVFWVGTAANIIDPVLVCYFYY